MITITNVLKNRYLPFLFAVPLFFAVHHYKGIIHDAVLYVTQYVYSIDPARFSGDPAFAFGNQDSLGFFSPIFGIFLELFGVSTGAFVFTILMQLAWIVVAVFFIKSLLRRIKASICFLPVSILFPLVFAFGMEFAHTRFFQYVEVCACSRSLSIVLGMAALIFLFDQKKILSFLLILAGTMIHPLTAGWCLPFWMFYFFPKTRIPVFAASLIFPFSYLLHLGPLDVLPADWLSRPLAFKPDYTDVSKYVLLLTFFIVLARTSLSAEVKRISFSLILLVIISFYWDVWGGYGEHIFLYQVQPWRFVWLPSLIAVPLAICYAKDLLRKMIKGRNVTTHDLGMLVLVLSFFSPRNLILLSALAVLLMIKKAKVVSMKGWIVTFASFLLAGFLVQQYLTWCLQGFSSFLGFNYMELYRIRDAFLFYQFAFSVAFVVFFIMRRKYIPAAIMVLSIFLSRFMLLPVLSLFIAFFPKTNKVKYWGGTLIIIFLMLFDGLIDVEARRMTLVEGMCRSFPWICIASTMSLVSIISVKKFSYWGMAIWLIICSLMAVVNYNNYSAKWRDKEYQIDQYLHEPLFPQIKERGRMLFYVSGEFDVEPRLQFLTGSYLSASTLVTSIFNKENYMVGLKRSVLINQKNLNLLQTEKLSCTSALTKLADVDTLIDRVNFLCGINEISHLVSDRTPLPLVKEDSAMVGPDQKVFLYGCIDSKP